MKYLNGVHCLLRCIDEVASERSKLSPSQEQHILRWARDGLSRFHRWLRDMEWYGLHAGCIGGRTQLPDSVHIATFPYIASHYFVKDVVDPLIGLCSTVRGRELVSAELVSAVECAWVSAREAYPDAIDPDKGAVYIWCSGLDRIDTKLAELREAVVRPPK